MNKANISIVEIIGIAIMTVVVVVLAVLQYRSTREIGQDEERRLKVSVSEGVRGFEQEFAYDIEQICEDFELDSESSQGSIEQRISRMYENWTRNAAHPELVSGVEIWPTENNRRSILESLDTAGGPFQEYSWPGLHDPLHAAVENQDRQLPPIISGRDAIYFPWIFNGNGPALIRPLFKMSARNDVDMQVQPIGFLIVELNANFLQQNYLPDLTRRHFGTSGLAVAIRTANPPYQPVFVSDSGFPISTKSPDGITNLVDAVTEQATRRGHPPVRADDAASQWQLVVQHPAGSVDVAVASIRRRNMAISFGLLGVLALSMVLIFSVVRRAQKLAQLQVEFVASVSHELCTPLSVINSAAENLADGVVEQPEQIREYAEIIRDQGKRLEHLVDQSLSIAAGRLSATRLNLRPTEISPLIANALQASGPMLREAAFSVKQEITPELPLIVADPEAVEMCLENLLSNAVKYSESNREIAVVARLVNGNEPPEVQVSVDDHGVGISEGDMSNIFEPFYRAPSVREGRVRGSGLGLYLVKKMMESMGGSVTVRSKVGYGTSFVLHFPVADAQAAAGALR